VSLFLQQQALSSAAKQGLPVTAVPTLTDLPTQISGGFGYVGLMDHAPHPNAARVFINWMLSREGQQLWQDAEQETSTRTDLTSDNYPEWFKDTVPKPGKNTSMRRAGASFSMRHPPFRKPSSKCLGAARGDYGR